MFMTEHFRLLQSSMEKDKAHWEREVGMITAFWVITPASADVSGIFYAAAERSVSKQHTGHKEAWCTVVSQF